jgi:hypothetical protein
MTKAEFVRVVSRLFPMYLLAWAFTGCTFLPDLLHSFAHKRGINIGGPCPAIARLDFS